IFLSVLLAYACEPFVRVLIRLGIPRPPAAVVLYFAIAIAVGAGARAAVDQVDDFLADVPDMVASLRRLTEPDTTPSKRGPLQRPQEEARALHDSIGRRSAAMRGVKRVLPLTRFSISSYISTLGRGAAEGAARAAVVALLTFFLVATGDRIKRRL